MSLTLYHYPACSTCRNARKWLKSSGIETALVHIVESPPSATQLETFILNSGLPAKRFFNTSGRSYREGGWKARVADLSVKEAAAALANDGKLIKRPLLVSDETVLVGFKDEVWHQALLGGAPHGT